MGWDRLLGTGGLLIRCSLSSSHKMYLAADKKGKSIQIHFQNEKLWEQGFGGWGGVAAIDTGFKMFFGMGWDGKDYWVLVELISKREKESKYIYKYTFEMRNYGNKGSVVGERWLLLTVDDYRSPAAKRKAQ